MSKRRELEAARRQAARRQGILILGIVLAVSVLLIGGAILLNRNSGSSAGTSTSAPLSPVTTGGTVATNPPNYTPNGRSWGPETAPIIVQEFIDYQCPACGQQARNYEKGIIEAYAGTGKVRYEYVTLSFIDTFKQGSTESRDAGMASYCAADQDKFWAYHTALFTNQNGENQGAFSKQRLKDLAGALGLDRAAFDACLDSSKYGGAMDNNSAIAQQKKVNSTPTFMVNNKPYTGFKSAADLKKIFAEVAPGVVP